MTQLRILALFAAILTCGAACAGAAGADEAAQIQESAPDLQYDRFLEDGNLKRNVLEIVSAHIARKRKAHGNLVYTGNPSGKERLFSVVRIFDAVSRSGGIYTVQVDVDEIGGRERLLLFFDVADRRGRLELSAVRLGPQHLRQI